MRRVMIVGLVFGIAVVTAASISAQSVSVPYTFSAGTTAKASEVNADFAKLVAALPGAEWLNINSYFNISGTDATMHNGGSISLTVPGPGLIIVIHTGSATFFGDNRTIDVGIGSSSTAFLRSVELGRLDGSGTSRFDQSYSVVAVASVSAAGTYTYYALAQGNTLFHSNSVNVAPSALVGVYLPVHY